LHYGAEIFSSRRRIFGAKRDKVTGEWRKLQIEQDYFPEDCKVKHSKAMKINQYSATKSFESPFRKSAESVMTVFI
jgi:cell division protein FtsL